MTDKCKAALDAVDVIANVILDKIVLPQRILEMLAPQFTLIRSTLTTLAEQTKEPESSLDKMDRQLSELVIATSEPALPGDVAALRDELEQTKADRALLARQFLTIADCPTVKIIEFQDRAVFEAWARGRK